MRRSLSIVMSIVLCMMLVLVGCSGGNNDSKKEVQEEGQSTNKASDPEVAFGDKFDPPVEMTTVRLTDPGVLAFRDGEDIKDNVHTRWMKDQLGIDMKVLWSVDGWDNYMTKLRLSLSAGEPLPDVIRIGGDPMFLNELINSGLVKPIGDAFDKYASDIVKEAYAQYPSGWDPLKKDGEIYGIPLLTDGAVQHHVMWIRSDWLSKVGLEAPKTIEELEKVMEAFVTQDPDGNGQNDTYGLAMGFKERLDDVQFLYGAFQTMPGIWHKNDDGSLRYGSLDPANKEVLETVKRWKDKGYVHPEIGLRSLGESYELFTSGKAGIIFGPMWFPIYPFPNLESNVPGAKVDVYPLPVGPGGEAGRLGVSHATEYFLFNKNFEHVDAFMLYVNSLWKAWEPGTDFYKYGYHEGYDYAIVDGELVMGDGIPGGPMMPTFYFLYGPDIIPPFQTQNTTAELHEGKAPETGFEKSLAANGPQYSKAGFINKQQQGIEMYDYGNFVTKTMETRWSQLKTLELETFIKIVYGELPLDAFDKFVENWKANGGDQITKEMNEWYKQ